MAYTYTPSSASVSTVKGSSTSSDYASTTAKQGSAGTQTPPHGQHSREEQKHHHGEKKEDRMKHDLLGIGSQFESKK